MDTGRGKAKKVKGRGRGKGSTSRSRDSSPYASPESGGAGGSQRRGRGRPRAATNLHRGEPSAGLFHGSPPAGFAAPPPPVIPPDQLERIQKALYETTFAKAPQLQYENKELLNMPTPFNCCQEDAIKVKLRQKMELGNVATRDGFVTICEEIAFEMFRERGKEVKMSDVMIKIVQWRARFKHFEDFLRNNEVHYYDDLQTVGATDEYIQTRVKTETEEERNFRQHGFEDYHLFHDLFITKKAAMLPNEPASNFLDPTKYDPRHPDFIYEFP